MRKNLILLLVLLLALPSLNAQKKYDHKSSYPIKTNGTIFLNTQDADITITAANIAVVEVEVHRHVDGEIAKEAFEIEYKTEDGNFYLTEMHRKGVRISWSGSSVRNYTIDLRVPLDAALNIRGDDDDYHLTQIGGPISIVAEDGDIEIDGGRCSSLDIRLEDGDITLRNLNADINLEVEDGDIYCENTNWENARIQSEDGDINCKNSSFGDLDLRISDGDVYLDLINGNLKLQAEDGDVNIGSLQGYFSEISTVDGDINLEITIQKESRHSIRSEDGDINIRHVSGGSEIDIEIEDGDVYASRDFEYIRDKEHYKTLRSRSSAIGNIDIKTLDGSVNIK